MTPRAGKYFELTKPKVTLLNLFVGVTCFALAAFPSVNPLKLATFALAGYLACGGCGAINCVMDQKVDSLMQRTSKRAIPSGAVSRGNALLFGSILIATGITISYFAFNAITALMMVLGAVFYLVVYTLWLKPASSWNVVIGGVAGCFAALSGWTAAANTLSLVPILISTVDFLWTPGHLWGLAIKKVKEYKKAGIPMLPVTHGIKKAAQITFFFNIVAVACSLVLSALGFTGIVYTVLSVSVGIWFAFESRKLLNNPSEEQGFRLFKASMPFLTCIMLGLLVDRFWFLPFK